MSNLLKLYQDEVRQKLIKEFGYKNALAVPRLVKIVVNIGLGEALLNRKVIETMGVQLSQITGQKPIVTYAKKDISSFKLRKGEAVGLKVTLRGKRMYAFLEKLVKIVLPRIRDFRGVSDKGFDKQSGYSLGIEEQIVFPEIDHSTVDKIRGLEVTFVTNADGPDKVKRILELLGMPFIKRKQ